MDYREELLKMIDRFNNEAVEEFKEAEMRIVRDSRFSSIRKNKDYDGHIAMLRRVKTKATRVDPKSVKIPDSDETASDLRRSFEKCIVIFRAVCDGYIQMQLALKGKSEGSKITYGQYKEINNKVKKARSDLNESMRDMDILYSEFNEFSKGDDTEDLGGIAYKTYDQL